MTEEKAITCEPQNYPKISNDLLKAAHQSGLMEMKLIILAASKLPQGKDDELDPLVPIYITKDDMIAMGCEAKNITRDLRHACNNLRKRKVTIPTPLGDLVTGWVHNILFFKKKIFEELKARYPNEKYDEDFINQLKMYNLHDVLPFAMNSKQNLMARLVIHPDILPFLVQLKNNYTQLDLMELAKLSDSVYSLRIFLMMMQWKDKGVLHKRIDDLRKEFKLEDKYPLTADLKRWVVDSAVREINKKTGWQVSYELKKTGRKYTHLEIRFGLKSVVNLANHLSPEEQIEEIFNSSGLDLDTLTLVKYSYNLYIEKRPPLSDAHAINLAKKAVADRWLPSRQAQIEMEMKKQQEKNTITSFLSDNELLAKGEPNPDHYADYAQYTRDLFRYNGLINQLHVYK